MAHLSQFIINHWHLWLAMLAILFLILLNEWQAQKQQAQELSPQAAVALINEDAAVIDLRDADSFRKGHIVNAVRANSEDFAQNKMNKYKSRKIIIVCARGLQSRILAAKLRKEGFEQPLVLAGGIAAWQNADLPLIKGK